MSQELIIQGNQLNDDLESTIKNQHTYLEEPLLPSGPGPNTNVGDDSEIHQCLHLNPSSPPMIQKRMDGLPLGKSLLLKTLWFLTGLGSSTWGRYAAIYYNIHNLNAQQIGLIGGLTPAVRSISSPLWGMIADRYHKRKQVFLITKVISTSLLLTLALPAIYHSIPLIFVISLCSVIFVSQGVLDAYTLDMLQESGNNARLYGRYRLWAAVSWGLGAILMGYITDTYGTFNINFVLYGSLGYSSCLLIAWLVPGGRVTSLEDDNKDTSGVMENTNEIDDYGEKEGISTSLVEQQQKLLEEEAKYIKRGEFAELINLVKDPRIIVFISELILVGSGMATVERLLFIFLINDLGASNVLCGLSVGMTVLLEVPIFWYGGFFLKTLGHDGMYTASMIFFIVRVYGYTMLTPSSVHLILALEVLHGCTYGLFWVATMDISNLLTKRVHGWNTFIPMAINSLFSCVGFGLGAIIGGWGMDRYGSKAMYRVVSFIMFGTLILHLVGSFVMRFWFGSKRSFLPVNAPSISTTTGNNSDEFMERNVSEIYLDSDGDDSEPGQEMN